MYLHRDSQRRIYFKGAVYFLTSATYNRYPFFKEKIFCDLFVENLKLCKKLKGFKLYGWFLGYDHFHLLIQVGDEFNYSEVMKNLKRVTSLHINIMIEGANVAPEGANIYSRFQWTSKLFFFQRQFIQKYPNKNPFPKFQWQKSYHDHIIRDESDFDSHFRYIQHNPLKHKLPNNWKYVFNNIEHEGLIDDFKI